MIPIDTAQNILQLVVSRNLYTRALRAEPNVLNATTLDGLLALICEADEVIAASIKKALGFDTCVVTPIARKYQHLEVFCEAMPLDMIDGFHVRKGNIWFQYEIPDDVAPAQTRDLAQWIDKASKTRWVA